MKQRLVAVVLAAILFPALSHAQPSSPPTEPSQSQTAQQQTPEEAVATGRIVSVGRGSLTIRTDDGQYRVFVQGRNTVRPKTLDVGSRVRVHYSTTVETGVNAPFATNIVVLEGPPAGEQPPTEEPVPASVRQVENQIARGFRRYGAGFRAGVALDPELISIGVHATLGPFFTRQLLFRPNFEFAYGELTTLVAINLEGIYRLNPTLSPTRWTPYAGGGPSFGFSHLGFSTPTGSERSFDFGDFDFKAGLNLLAGVEKGNGVFVELKTTLYTSPHLRLLVGITF